MKNPVIFPLIIFVAILLNMGCNAQDKKEKQSLKGEWKFILGDDMQFASPDYNDSDWEDIRVPSSWEDEGFRNYDGYAWYRKTFEIDFRNRSESLFLHLGQIDDVDEVFFNGKRIGGMGSFPPDFLSAWNQERTYPIPNDLINDRGDNVISVRVYDTQQDGGILGWNVGIYNYGGINENAIQLMGRWKFQPSDNMDWKAEDFDDSSWEDIMVPSRWENQGYARYDGLAWYRKKFEMPADFSTKNKILILGKIDDIDEVYVNGVMIGSTGDFDRKWMDGDEYDKVRTYFIADDVLKSGTENVIAVRVNDLGRDGGIYQGPVVIIDANDYKDYWRSYHKNNYHYYGWFWTFIEE